MLAFEEHSGGHIVERDGEREERRGLQYSPNSKGGEFKHSTYVRIVGPGKMKNYLKLSQPLETEHRFSWQGSTHIHEGWSQITTSSPTC